MKTTLYAVISYWVLYSLPCGAQQTLDQILALKAGNSWVYKGSAEWYDENQPDQTANQEITWKVEISEQAEHGDLRAFLVKGSFDDLSFYGPDTKPGEYLWIVYQGRFYSHPADPGVLARFHNAKDSLTDLVQQDDPMLQLPLKLNVCTSALQPEEQPARDDLLYCWHLEEKQNTELKISGVPPDSRDVWQAWLQTNPDSTIEAFAPGIGFVSYDYSHHGTTSEVHLKLVEAHLN